MACRNRLRSRWRSLRYRSSRTVRGVLSSRRTPAARARRRASSTSGGEPAEGGTSPTAVPPSSTARSPSRPRVPSSTAPLTKHDRAASTTSWRPGPGLPRSAASRAAWATAACTCAVERGSARSCSRVARASRVRTDDRGRAERVALVGLRAVPDLLVPAGARHPGRVPAEGVELGEPVADQPGVLVPAHRPRTSRRAPRAHQLEGVEPAGDHDDGTLDLLAPAPHVRGHHPFSRQRVLGLEHLRLVVEPGHRAPGEDVVQVAPPVVGGVGGAQLEQPVPQVVVVDAAQPVGHRLHVPAVGEVALLDQGGGGRLVGALAVAVPGLVGPRHVDQRQLRPEGGALTQRDPLGAVVAQRVERGAHRALAPALREQGHRGAGLLVDHERHQVVEVGGALDQHGGGSHLAQQRPQRPRAARAVVAHGHEPHVVVAAEQLGGGLADDVRQPRVDAGRRGHCQSPRAASWKAFQRGSRRARSRTTVSK